MGVCGQPERELLALTLGGFLATRSWGSRFSSGKICARANGPPERETPCEGSTRHKSGALNAAQSHSRGLGQKAPVNPKREERTERERTNRKPKRTRKEEKEKSLARIIYTNPESCRFPISMHQHLINIYFHAISMHLHQICARFRLGVNPNHFPKSHGTSCHGNLLFTCSIIGRALE